MRKNTFKIVIVLSGLLFSSFAQSEEQQILNGFKEDEIVQAYMRQQRVEEWLNAQKDRIEAERSGAALLQNPELNLTYEPMTFDDGREEKQSSIWLTQRFDAWGARGHRQQAANETALFDSIQLQIKLRDEIKEVKLSFYQLKLLQDRYYNHKNWVGYLTQLVTFSEQQLEVEQQSQLDHFRLQQALSAALLKLSQVKSEVVFKSRELKQLTGLNISNIAEPLIPRFIDSERVNSLRPPAQTLELELLSALEANLRALKLEARSSGLPEISVGLGLRKINDGRGNNSEVAFQFGIELPIFERGQYELTRYERLKSIVSIERELIRNSIDEKFGALKELLRLGMKGINDAKLHNVKDMLDAATESYWLGETLVSDLIGIHRTQVELVEQQLNQELAIRKHWIDLQALLQQTQDDLR